MRPQDLIDGKSLAFADCRDSPPELCEWRPVFGWEAFYEISNCGQIRSIALGARRRRRRLLRLSTSSTGYLHLCLSARNRRIWKAVHRLVGETFLGTIPPRHEINHRDGNKQNNRVSNLEIVTHEENYHHAVRAGLMHHKLSDPDVRLIRQLRAAGWTSSRVAEKFGISDSHVRNITLRRDRRLVE